MQKKKILINTPHLNKIGGGVTNHYLGLKPYWSNIVKYNYIGKRGENCFGPFWLPYDIVKFIFRIIIFNPDYIILNPSLNKRAVNRDKLFLIISRFFRRKTVVMFHGWDSSYIENNNKNKIDFISIFNKASLIFVLSNTFRSELIEWGITSPIHLTSTKVSDSLLDGFDIKSRKGLIKNILILSRIVKNKGIAEAIDAYTILKSNHPDLRLYIVGDGEDKNYFENYVLNKKIEDIHFCGYLSGNALASLFKKCDFYLFPTFHNEGMPTSVLEAMAFGLPILTRPIGGINDFFKDGINGILTSSKDPVVYAHLIDGLINDTEKIKQISNNNFVYAKEHFLASSVALKMEKIIVNI